MSYLSDIFKRANIQQISEFLLNGGGLMKVNHMSYGQRLAEGRKQAMKMIQTHFPNEREEMESKLLNAVSAYEDVYMEIGLQAGILLAVQIFNFRT